jgi:hypothetical protein
MWFQDIFDCEESLHRHNLFQETLSSSSLVTLLCRLWQKTHRHNWLDHLSIDFGINSSCRECTTMYTLCHRGGTEIEAGPGCFRR